MKRMRKYIDEIYQLAKDQALVKKLKNKRFRYVYIYIYIFIDLDMYIYIYISFVLF
jgi:hypothetical protein